HQQVPLLLGPVVAGQLQRRPRLHLQPVQARVHQDVGDQHLQRPHLAAARDGTTRPSVDLTPLRLLTLLALAGVPERLHSLQQAVVEVVDHPMASTRSNIPYASTAAAFALETSRSRNA